MEQQCRHGKANLMLRNLFTLKNQQDLYDGFTVGVDLIQKKKKKNRTNGARSTAGTGEDHQGRVLTES